MDTPTYRVLWLAVTVALPELQDFQVSVSIHIPAEFMRSSQLHFNNFDRRSRPLIDQQCLTWPAATMAYLSFKDFQVNVSWLFTAVANTFYGIE